MTTSPSAQPELDLWQGTDQYGAVFLPGGAPENFVATVKVASFDATHSNAKAGIMVRNDITGSGSSPGYLVFSEKGNGEAEYMHDAGGNGQVNNSTEPVATGCGTSNEPTWLKVQKFGTVFSVFCSRNGVDWTQVGSDTTIPSATAVQDIGLFVVSHIAGTQATAEFTDWAIDLDPEVPPTEPEYDDPPGCAGAMSDEFDGPLDAGRWTVVRGATGATPATSNGQLMLPVTNGDINEASAGPISYVGQPVPSGDFQVTTKVDLAHDNEWQHAALAQIVDDNNYVKFALTQNQAGSRFFEFQTETNGTRTWHQNNVTVPADFPSSFYLRLTQAGSTLSAAYSTDGTTFTTLTGTGALKAGGTLGVFAGGDTDAQNKTAAVDWFRVTPDGAAEDPGFDDEFDGASLDGCRWDKVHNYKLDRLDLADGKLSIDTFNADISGGDNGPIENLILQTPPEGDWTVETKMTAPLAKNWQLAGLMLYEDDDHYVKYDIVADNAAGAPAARRVELRYEDGGNLTGPGVADLPPPASATDTWWLRLTKTGNTYTGAISADGETWTQTPGSVTVELDDPGLGVMAIGPQQVTPVTVDFDYIRLVTEAENSAPVIGEATATPASGTAPLEVDFDVTATDADEDELTYSWDFDGDGEADSTQQRPTHTYTEAGTYEAEVTVSDGEATDSATVTVEVEEDPSAPQVEAFSDVTSGEAPLEVRFTSTGLDPDGLALTYRWDFGNGDSAFTRNARYTYAEPGTYTATVTVTDREGKTASDSIEITVEETVNDAPTVTASADVTTGPAPLRVEFDAVGADEEDRPADLEYEWDFGDGGSALGRSPAHRYTAPGTYTATVTVTDSGGETATDTVAIEVTNTAPTVQAAASPRTGVAPHKVTFSSQGHDADGGALTYAWDFGDGGTATTRNASHTYVQAGSYTAEVTVTDRHGATGTAEVAVTVTNPPATRRRPSASRPTRGPGRRRCASASAPRPAIPIAIR